MIKMSENILVMTSAGKTAARITMRVYSGPVCDNIGQIRVFPDQLVGPHIGSGQLLSKVQVYPTWCQSDPPEKYHLNVKKLPNSWLFFKCQKFSFFSKKLPKSFWKKCQVFGNFLTVKWQFSGGSALDISLLQLYN